MKSAAAEEEKVFVAVPAEPKAARTTLSWALTTLCGGGAGAGGGGVATIVVAHVHVPPQMIPVMGGKFHASKLSPEQVSWFRRIEREKVDRMLDDYIHHCFKMKVKCEKLVLEKDDVASGLVELIGLHGVTKLVVSAAADRHYSKKLDRPVSKTAAAVMERADPSCKIWFVCREQLICTRDNEVQIAPAVVTTAPLLPNPGHEALHLSICQEEDDIEMELGFYDEVKEACKAAESLMNRALKESWRRQKADEEADSLLQKAKEYEELYLEEVSKRQELETALAEANREIEQLRQVIQLRNTDTEELQEATTTGLILEQRSSVVAAAAADDDDDDDDDGATKGGGFAMEPCLKCVQVHDHGDGAGELEALLGQIMKVAAVASSSPSSVIPPTTPPPPPDGDRCWLVHRDLAPDFALRAVIQDYMTRRRRQQQQQQRPFP